MGNFHRRFGVLVAIAVVAGMAGMSAQGQPARTTTAKSLRCSFPIKVVGSWKKDGAPDGAIKPGSPLVLVFDAINTEDGTAQLKSGSANSGVIVRLSGRYLHFMQVFRTGPMYTTTVFDEETRDGKLKAVHSRHESFAVPLPGATSSPEQYYGECQIVA